MSGTNRLVVSEKVAKNASEPVITKALENANEVAVQALNEKKKKDDK